jgi:Mg/Co/Ni transporter MgtE
MNPDFVSVPATATVADALEAIRTSRVPAEALHAVFVWTRTDSRSARRRSRRSCAPRVTNWP